MSMSVGLGKIQNDPKATPLTRKALGALSTPHLLVDNQGISIDDSGRLFIRLADGGGVLMTDEGLTTETVYGIDSEINLEETQRYDRDWNMRLTGSAPNYIQDDLYIGADDLAAELAEFNNVGLRVDDAKVQIYAQHTQLRLFHDKTSWLSVRTLPNGFTEFYSAGPDEANCGFNFITTSGSSLTDSFVPGDAAGVRINNGAEITQILTVRGFVNFPGGGAAGVSSWFEQVMSFSPGSCRDDRDVVFATPLEAITLPAQWLGWSAYIDWQQRLCVRISWFDVTAAYPLYWKFTIIKYKTVS